MIFMYEFFEHPADIGIRGIGKTLEEAFIEAGKALFALMCNIEKIEKKKKIKLFCEAYDTESLFVEFLNTLIYLKDTENMVFCDFIITIRGNRLDGVAFGENYSPKKHGEGTEVKAATYSELRVEKVDGNWVAQCVVDV